jgi:hypothetical protein
MAGDGPSPLWLKAFSDFVAESDPIKQKELLGPLEGAIFQRQQELDGDAENIKERHAIEMASDKILEIKINKLGFPGWKGDGFSSG